jgi:hypothetical protein
MSNGPASLVPITDEQAKLFREAVETLRSVGGFLKEVVGTVPEDLVGLLAGDWLRVRRAENLARMIEKMQERIKARKKAESREQPSLSIALPILMAAADESRDELQDLWARLLAAATDPERAQSFRVQFIEVAKQMDPLDAAVLQSARDRGGVTGQIQLEFAEKLKVRRDEIEVSLNNLARLKLVSNPPGSFHVKDFLVGSFCLLFLIKRDCVTSRRKNGDCAFEWRPSGRIICMTACQWVSYAYLLLIAMNESR